MSQKTYAVKGKVFWRNHLSRKGNSDASSGDFVPLFLLVESEPYFIPGYLALVDTFNKAPDWCSQKASIPICKEKPKNSGEVLEQATALFPDDPELARAKVDALAKNKMYLEASIAARQFALFFPDYPGAEAFQKLSEKYMKEYRSDLRSSLIGQTILGCGFGLFVGRGVSACGIAFLLIEGESSMGAQFAAGVKQQAQLVDDPEVNQYIQDIADRLTPLMGRDDFEYEFYVVQDSNLNAFALPGGKIFINTGAILGTESEAELAGLLAHEIAHAVFSHGYQRVAQQNLGATISQVIPIESFFRFITSAYSRSQEKQSDILGTKVIASTGYAADGLRNFMVTINERTGDQGQRSPAAQWYATHPAPPERVRYLEELIERNGYNRFAYEGVERHREIQQRLR